MLIVTDKHLFEGFFIVDGASPTGRLIVEKLSHARLCHNLQNGFIRFEWRGSAQYAAVHSGIQMVQLVQMARLTTRAEIMPILPSANEPCSAA